MTHDDLLDKVYWHWRKDARGDGLQPMNDYRRALLEIIRLHEPHSIQTDICVACSGLDARDWPCLTLQAIIKELK